MRRRVVKLISIILAILLAFSAGTPFAFAAYSSSDSHIHRTNDSSPDICAECNSPVYTCTKCGEVYDAALDKCTFCGKTKPNTENETRLKFIRNTRDILISIIILVIVCVVLFVSLIVNFVLDNSRKYILLFAFLCIAYITGLLIFEHHNDILTLYRNGLLFNI